MKTLITICLNRISRSEPFKMTITIHTT